MSRGSHPHDGLPSRDGFPSDPWDGWLAGVPATMGHLPWPLLLLYRSMASWRIHPPRWFSFPGRLYY
mgnify:CR=1 FL=1